MEQTAPLYWLMSIYPGENTHLRGRHFRPRKRAELRAGGKEKGAGYPAPEKQDSSNVCQCAAVLGRRRDCPAVQFSAETVTWPLTVIGKSAVPLLPFTTPVRTTL